MEPSIDEFFAAFNQVMDVFSPVIAIAIGLGFGIGVLGWIARIITEAFAAANDFDEITVTDQRKKKKNDYLDYYDQLAEQDQYDPNIAYYDEVISEEMHR